MMKIGISAFAWCSHFGANHLNILPRIREFGIESLEVPLIGTAKLHTTALRRALDANDLEVSICAILPYDRNPISPDPLARNRAIEHLRVCIETTAEIEGTILCGPLYAPLGYMPSPYRTVDEWNWGLDCFHQLGPLLAATGVSLALEPVNRAESHFMKTCAEARLFCDALQHHNIGVNLDTFHANIEEASIEVAVSASGHHLKHVHVSENQRGPLGSGHIDFSALVRELRRRSFSGALMIEGFGTPDIKDNLLPLWRDPSISSDRLVEQSFTYLKDLLSTLRL